MKPEIDGLLECFLVVDDLTRTRAFYEDTLGLEPHGEPGERGCTFLLPGGTLLGLVDREAARDPNETPDGVIPACVPEGAESRGPGSHLAFAVSERQLDAWRAHLVERAVEIVQEMEWGRGGRSLYFRDPQGNLLELATPGVWDFY